MPEEFLDIVDENDTVIGKRTIRDCLRGGLLHRAVVIFLVGPKGKIYLQKRAATRRGIRDIGRPPAQDTDLRGRAILKAQGENYGKN